MPYRFATEKNDYSDYAGGHVFYGTPGQPAFPVRLVSELFQRCLALRQKMALTAPVVLYDPCCGSAYHLSTLAYLHWPEIDTIIGSDIDAGVLSVAARNLSLLTASGLEKRAAEIAAMQNRYGKPSHAAASKSAQRLSRQLGQYLQVHQINRHLFAADATNGRELASGLRGKQVDIVLADIPYGKQSQWLSANASQVKGESLLEPMLEALLSQITDHTIVAIVANKAQKCGHEKYKRLDQFQIGKRRLTLLQRA